MTTEEKEKLDAYLKGIVLNLPDSPGCYQYLNDEGEIIYVGKAKNLKRRVYSYFSKDHQSRKTAMLVSKIRDIKYIVVNSEEDALLLENNLIKRYKPHYNVLLKDDKTYPSICVTNEYFPRIFKTRHIVRNGSVYFGPYSHIPTLNALLELIKNLYPLRTCHLALTPENIRSGKFNVCLEYHIKNCKGPCIGPRRIPPIHPRSQGNPERKHGRNQPEHARRNASVGGGNAFRRGTSHQKEVRPFGKLPEQERSGEQRPPQHRRLLH